MANLNYFDVGEVIADKIPDIKPATGDDVNADDLATVTRICESVSAFIDSYCKRRPGYFSAAVFDGDELDEAGTMRRYRGEGRNFLRIGNHVAGSVSIGSPAIADSRYYEHPENGWLYAIDSSNDNGGDYYPDFSENKFFAAGQIYEVTAVWKFASTPADIIEAGKQIISNIWDKGRGVIGEVTPSGFVIEREIPLTARAILNLHRKREFEIE